MCCIFMSKLSALLSLSILLFIHDYLACFIPTACAVQLAAHVLSVHDYIVCFIPTACAVQLAAHVLFVHDYIVCFIPSACAVQFAAHVLFIHDGTQGLLHWLQREGRTGGYRYISWGTRTGTSFLLISNLWKIIWYRLNINNMQHTTGTSFL